MSLVEVKNVSFTYPNGFVAVDGVSFNLEKGENIAIVGQNGAGKTTTVKMLNGLTKPTSGDIIVDGKNTRDYTTAQITRTVGYVFQNPDDQIFNNSVYKEIEYGLKRMKLSSEERERRIMDAASLTGMEKFLDQNPYDFPLSVRKFVTIASVIASGCEVLIFDEPTAGQDLDGLERLSRLIKELTARGKALITITHDMEFVAENFERLIIMCNKKIVADGRTGEVFYYKDIMEKVKLKQPCVVELSGRIGAGELGLDLDAVARFIREGKAAGPRANA
ncbi:MAG: energy-coupling factor ABC transporter ATP-binding protein [Clostridium sp.]|nr:energy-coupling factor ABC transporter ATP-binding protein [Clostridium sp.]